MPKGYRIRKPIVTQSDTWNGKHVLVCRNCDATFTAFRTDAKTCSDKCRIALARRNNPLEPYHIKCAECDIEFDWHRPAKYCSNACKQKAYRRRK